MTQNIGVVFGTRPEIIKLAPVIHELGPRAFIINSGQHYDLELSGQHTRQFEVPDPDIYLDGVGGTARGAQIARMIASLTDVFQARRLGMVLVQGDTNTVSAAAQAANYAGIAVGHVEAGLRSYDRAMPEEINRLVTGNLADVHFAPTVHSAANLTREGVSADRVFVTGNTIVEATHRAMTLPTAPLRTWFPDGVVPARYAVATIHRPENTDTASALLRVLRGLRALPLPVVLLLHPRTRAAIERFHLAAELDTLIVHSSPSSPDFLRLISRAVVVVSDSGGVQEEATVLRVPVAVIRNSTERPEAVDAGVAVLVRPDTDIPSAVTALLSRPRLAPDQPTPYGDGLASRRISAVARLIADGASPINAVAQVESDLQSAGA